MGKAVVDPPQTAAPAPLANADDLLSKLAGEEIDRLLAEADIDASRASAKAAAATTAESSAKAVPAMTAPITAASAPGQSAGPGQSTGSARTSAAPAPAVMPTADDLGGSLDDLFAELTKNEAPSISTPSNPEPAKAEAPKAEPSKPERSPAQALEDAMARKEVTADEIEEMLRREEAASALAGDSHAAVAAEIDEEDARRAAGMVKGGAGDDLAAALNGAAAPLDASAIDVTAAQEAAGIAHGTDPTAIAHAPADGHSGTGSMEVPTFDSPADLASAAGHGIASKLSGILDFLVTPLEWINAPMDAYPDSLRDGLGWIGVATFINAIAVLLYVMLFRRH